MDNLFSGTPDPPGNAFSFLVVLLDLLQVLLVEHRAALKQQLCCQGVPVLH